MVKQNSSKKAIISNIRFVFMNNILHYSSNDCEGILTKNELKQAKNHEYTCQTANFEVLLLLGRIFLIFARRNKNIKHAEILNIDQEDLLSQICDIDVSKIVSIQDEKQAA